MTTNFTVTALLLSIALCSCHASEATKCSRPDSRIARQILQGTLYPILTASGRPIPWECPVSPPRDMYSSQETRKIEENPARWYCNYCGKAFTAERFVDNHLDARHSDTIGSGEDAVCLADHCDYLRCEVVSGTRTPSYWDRTLCRQGDLDKLRRRCEAVVKSCLPAMPAGMERHELFERLKAATCSALTCERYWEALSVEGSAHGRLAYAVVTCILLVGLMLYYLVMYTHFYTDNRLLYDDDEPTRPRHGPVYSNRDPYGLEIRSRHQHVFRS